jgi:hypothetical protein
MFKKISIVFCGLYLMGCKGVDGSPKGSSCDGLDYTPIYKVNIHKVIDEARTQSVCIALDNQPYYFLQGEECEIKYYYHADDAKLADITAKIKGYKSVTLYNVPNNYGADACKADSDFTTEVEINMIDKL